MRCLSPDLCRTGIRHVSILKRLDPRAILGRPTAYGLHSRVAAPEARKRFFVERFLHPAPGERVLDIGCGTAPLLEYMPEVDYVGFDLSQPYIEEARLRFGERGTFHQRALTPEVVGEQEPFDLAMAIGVVHHLDDAEAETLFRVAHDALASGGRLVTCDGAIVQGQNLIARLLLSLDRGQYVRTPAAYEALARRVFQDVSVGLHHDLNAYPYTHCVLTCGKPG